jgi:hypothetical protein
MGEDLDALYIDLCAARSTPEAARADHQAAHGARASSGAEGSPQAHEVLKADVAIEYLEKRGGYEKAIEMLKAAKPSKSPLTYKGSSGVGKNRDDFGKIINEILDGMSEADRIASVKVFDNDLEGSCGLHHIRKKHPEVFVRGGIMERGNYSAAAGFGSDPKGKQGIFATFSAFLEMCVSEITMARLNFSNVLAHFSHSGVDDMADNTCHFGINSMFADGGVTPVTARTRRGCISPRPAPVRRLREAHLQDPGCASCSARAPCRTSSARTASRCIRASRSSPAKTHRARGAGGRRLRGRDGRDRVSRAGCRDRLQEQGVKVGLINKPRSTSSMRHDEDLAGAPFVLVAEGWNVKTGWAAASAATAAGRLQGQVQPHRHHLEGCGGLWQQMGHQGLDPSQIYTMPGMTTHLNLRADEPGDYAGISSHYSGDGFSDMRFVVHAVSPTDYQQWLEHTRSEPAALDTASYADLARASSNVTPQLYGKVDPMMLDHILQTATHVPATGQLQPAAP